MKKPEREAILRFLVAMNTDFAVQDEVKMARLRNQFLVDFGHDVTADPDYVLGLLELAYRQRNGADVELALAAGVAFRVFGPGSNRRDVDLLLRLLECDWHYCHEGIAHTLQKLRPPEAVDALYRTALARYPYLDFDKAYALGVKCVWALADIGTPAAVEKLRALARCRNKVIKRNAREQLVRLAAATDSGVTA